MRFRDCLPRRETLKQSHFALFVYRLGHAVFIRIRGVRFSYSVPDLITLVPKPVGNITSVQVDGLELLCYTKDGNQHRLRTVVTLEQLGR